MHTGRVYVPADKRHVRWRIGHAIAPVSEQIRVIAITAEGACKRDAAGCKRLMKRLATISPALAARARADFRDPVCHSTP
jgi:hypothetical protein